MKKIKNNFKSAAVILAAAALFTACSKDYNDNPADSALTAQEGKKITDKKEQRKIDDAISRLPGLAIYNEPSDSYILLDIDRAKDGFNFASADAAVSFSGPEGSVTYVQAPDGTFYQLVTPGDGTGGGGGGVVTAGDISLSMDLVVCFSSGDDFFGSDLFSVGDGFSGFSGAIGISGDFEALSSGNIDEDADPFDFFNGFAAYYVFDGTANGNYDVVDFLTAEGEDENFVSDKGIAFLLSFQDDGAIYFSVDGELSVSGGSISFDGTYAGITGFFIGFDEGEPGEEPDEAAYEEVPGSGTIFCN